MQAVYGIEKQFFTENGVKFESVLLEETYASFDDAWNAILGAAELEADNMNVGCAEGVSFGIPQDEEFNKRLVCKVQQYYNPENDDTGNTAEYVHYRVVSSDNLKFNSENIRRALQVLIDNGIAEDEAGIVLQAIGYAFLDTELNCDNL